MLPGTHAETIGTAVSTSAFRVSLAAAVTFLALLSALHLVRPDLDPSWRVISEYGIGPSGWLMTLAFLSLALSCASLASGLRSEVRSRTGQIGLLLLVVSATGMTLAAVFTTDPLTAAAADRTTRGRMHELGAMLDLTPVAAALVSWSLVRHGRGWGSARAWLYGTAGLTWAALLTFLATLGTTLPRNNGQFGPAVPIGWPNRLMVVSYCVWLIAMAAWAMRIGGRRSLSESPI